MSKKLMLLLCLPIALACTRTIAAYVPIPVTGFNQDVIANGNVSVAASTTAPVDNAGYYFLDQTFTALGAPTFFLPSSGTINSNVTAGLSFQMASASGNNALQLTTQNASGTLTVTTPQSAGIVYLLVTSGAAASTVNVTVTFTDGTTQVFTGQNISYWYNGGQPVVQGIGRTSAAALDNSSGNNPRLYQMALPLLSSNYSKLIASITIAKTNATNTYPHIMGVSIMTPCTTPPAQPSALSLTTVSTAQITGSFTAAAPAADGYIVVRYPSGATPVNPVDGTSYTAGSSLGSGTVIQVSAGTTFTANALSGGTAYTFYIYSFNSAVCTGGPVYNAAAPLSGTQTTMACTGLSGIIPVGSAGTYPTLTAAITAIAAGNSGPVTLELQNNYTSSAETFPIVIGNLGCLSSANPLTIRPAAGANGLSISSSNAGPTIDLKAVDYVTIDGTPGGSSGSSSPTVTAAGNLNTVNLNIVNTHAAGVAIRIDSGSSKNRILLCDLQGQNTTNAHLPTSMAGVVYFGNNGPTGNDNNLIDRCNIHSTGPSTTPSIGIYALGATNNGLNVNFNDNDTVRGCHIYDYFLPANNSCGLELIQGVNEWTISNNHFFQTATRTYTAAGYNRAIWIIPDRNAGSVGNGFQITNNYIGGTAPLCGGAPYTLTAFANSFDAIRIETFDGATPNPTSIQNNTITNLSITSTSTGDVFRAITSVRGYTNIGTLAGNTIGTLTGSGGAATGGISIASGNGSSHHMIMLAPANGSPVQNIRKNRLGNIRLSNAGNHFFGIFVTNNPKVLIDSNQIGNLTTPHSITVASTSNSASSMRGICLASGNANVTITNNTIANLTDSTTSTSATKTNVAGIAILSATGVVPAITGNTICNLQNSAHTPGTGQEAAVLGICMMGTTANAYNISNNKIYALVSTATSGGVFVTGIFARASTSAAITNTIAKNLVHSFSLAANNNANIRGIETNQGRYDVTNNMIRLGIHPDGTSLNAAARIDGILEGAGMNSNYYFNSIYIGGTGVGNGTGSACFRKETTGGAGMNEVKNNIFVNERSNAAGGGVHYVLCANSPFNVSYNNNLYRFNGTGGAFASTNGAGATPTAGAYSTGWSSGDVSSVTGDPQFAAPTANAAGVDLHITAAAATPVEGTGIAIAGTGDDIDGDQRSAMSPTDIGADAGNFTALLPCTAPITQPTTLALTPVSTTQINGSFTASVPAASGYLVVACVSGNTPSAPVNGVGYVPGSALGNGVVVATGPATSFSATGLLGATPYVFYVYGYNDAGCIYGPAYLTAAPLTGSASTLPCNSAMNGIVPVGPGQTYATLTSAAAYLNANGLGGAVTLELQSNYVSTGETFPIVIGNFGCLSPTNPLTIRPAAGANGLSVNSSNAGPTIDLKTAAYVTIDGTPGGSSGTSSMTVTAAGSLNAVNLNIVNTHAAGVALRIDNGSSNNRILLCDLQGQNTTASNAPTSMAGVLYFGSNGATGNDNNLIDRCNVHSTGTSTTPSMGIYALGAVNNGLDVNFNDNDTIRGCYIYDYFRPTNSSSCALELTQGISGWTISDNHFFQTSPRTYTAPSYNRAIWILSDRNPGSAGNGFRIINNYIGGSAPFCGGIPYRLTNSFNYFDAIVLETVDGATPDPTSVQNNTITNISVTSTYLGEVFHGISVYGRGHVNIGTIAGNTIGTLTGSGGAATGGISIASGDGSNNHMIMLAPASGSPVYNIRKNRLGNIRLSNPGNHFSGIMVSNNPKVLIDSNQLGSLTTPHSITAASTTNMACSMRGIYSLTGNSNVTVTNNIIANFTDSSTSGSATKTNVIGIAMLSATGVVTSVTGNTIHNLQNSASTAGVGQEAAVLGICMMGTTANACNLSNNTIHSLVSAAPSASVLVAGMFLQGPANASVVNAVSKNRIHSFDLTAANNNAIFRGIETRQGRYEVSNNMIRLGIRPDGTSMNTAARIDGILEGAGMNSNYYFNSIYIGGTGVGNGNGSACFRKETTGGAGVNEVMNNIFDNERSNATNGGVHYALCANSPLNVTYNNNLYRYNGTDGAFASTSGVSLTPTAAVYTTGWISGDVSSVTGDPQFVAPAANAAGVDLHINATTPSTPVEGTGIAIAGIDDDIDGDLRSVLSPTDIGADAGHFGALSCVAPIAPLMEDTICANPVLLKWNSSKLATAYDVYLGAGTIATTLVSANQPDTTYLTTTLTPGLYTWKIVPRNATGIASGCDSFVFTVSTPPSISVQPVPQTTICAGTAASFAVVAGGDSLTYQWYLNGNPISGATADTYQVATASFSDTGNYTVVVKGTVLCGDITSATAHLTVLPLPQPVITASNFVLDAGSYSSYQWYYNGVPIFGEITQNYAAFQNGSYTVYVTDANGCSNMSTPYVISTISVPYLSGGGVVDIYPNPTSGLFHIKAPVRVDIAVRDATGKIILEKKNAESVDLGRYPAGLYLVLVTDAASGQRILAERIVKTTY